MGLLLKVVVFLVILFLIFNLSLKFFDGNNVIFDKVFEKVKVLTNKFKKSYEYIRQHVCKKSDEVNDDSGAVLDSTELYDSSSVWED
jgi:hypothetical protein